MSTRAYIAAQLLNASFFALSGGLTIICVCNLVGGKPAEEAWSYRKRALLAYVAFMGGLSLVAIVYDSVRFISFVQYLTDVLYHHASNNPVRYFEDDMLRFVLPLAVWGAEGFMLWRLYEHVRPTEKGGIFLLGCLTTVSIGLSIASSTPAFSHGGRYRSQFWNFVFAYRFFSFTTALINVIVSVTIAALMIFRDRVFDGVEHTWQAYARVVVHILIAAGGPLTLCAILAASFFKIWVHDYMVIPIFVMPQISVISALLIVYGLSGQADEGVIRLDDTSVPEGDTASQNA